MIWSLRGPLEFKFYLYTPSRSALLMGQQMSVDIRSVHRITGS